jgi:hypothetical protein
MDAGESMDFSTLGGCIASKVFNGKQARYGALAMGFNHKCVCPKSNGLVYHRSSSLMWVKH